MTGIIERIKDALDAGARIDKLEQEVVSLKHQLQEATNLKIGIWHLYPWYSDVRKTISTVDVLEQILDHLGLEIRPADRTAPYLAEKVKRGESNNA